MDPLTQGLLGAATAQLGFRQRLGRSATWMAAITAVLPDFDTGIARLLRLTGLEVDQFALLRYHRGLSHSLLAVPVIALLVALPWWWRRRRKQSAARMQTPEPTIDNVTHPEIARKPAPLPPQGPSSSFWVIYACTFVAALSHPLLDWCTSYGTQLLAPISEKRFALDAVSIIDIIYTPILILTLLICWLLRRLSRRQVVRATLVVGWLGILLSTAYLAAGYFMHNLAVDKAVELAGRTNNPTQEQIISANAYPYLGTILLWRTTVQTPDRWLVARIRPLNDLEENNVRRESARKQDSALIRRAGELPRIKTYRWFAMEQVRTVYRHEEGRHVVEFHDMRYGQRPESVKSLWPVRVTFDAAGRVSIERFQHFRDGSILQRLNQVWTEIRRP